MRYSQQLKTLRLKLLFSQDVLRTTPPELSPLSFIHLKFRSGKNTSVLPEFALIQSASVFFTIISLRFDPSRIKVVSLAYWLNLISVQLTVIPFISLFSLIDSAKT